MPRFDGRGPMGQGAKSGRGLGYCQPGTEYPSENIRFGRDIGRGGRPYGGSRGFMHGGARGNGRIRPCWRPAFATGVGSMPSELERAWLAEKAERLQEELQQIADRLAGLESERTAE